MKKYLKNEPSTYNEFMEENMKVLKRAKQAIRDKELYKRRRKRIMVRTISKKKVNLTN